MISRKFAFAVVIAGVASAVLWLAGAGSANNDAKPVITAGPVPVLVELFTSEGCSDCPPADALLAKLDKMPVVPGAEVIVLSEHVDYWDGDGWRDPYSSHDFSVRQEAFARRFGLASVYTPQMVVDGSAQFVGSDEGRAILAIEKAARAKEIFINVSDVHRDADNQVSLHVDAGVPASRAKGTAAANILVAVADDSDESHVGRGENAGRTLRHVAVVRSLTMAGTTNDVKNFSRDLKIKVDAADKQNFRVVAFIQDRASGKILGATAARIANEQRQSHN